MPWGWYLVRRVDSQASCGDGHLVLSLGAGLWGLGMKESGRSPVFRCVKGTQRRAGGRAWLWRVKVWAQLAFVVTQDGELGCRDGVPGLRGP